MKTISINMKFYLGDKVYYFDRDFTRWVETTIHRIACDMSKGGFSLCYYDEDGESHTEKQLYRKPVEHLRK